MDRFRRHMLNRLTLACWFGATALTTITGPFGTFATMEAVPRFLYWALMIWVSIAVAYGVRYLIVEFVPPMSRARRDLVMAVLFTALFTPFLEFLNHQVFRWSPHDYIALLAIIVCNFIIASGIAIARRGLGYDFLEGVEVAAQEPEPVAVPSVVGAADPGVARVVRPRLYERMELAEGRRVLRLTVDDHYVIATLDDGQEQRLLMRFSDAVREMDGQDGFLTHRSHWVSADAVVRAVRMGGRNGVETADGVVLPVSRTYWKQLEARGFVAGVMPEAMASE